MESLEQLLHSSGNRLTQPRKQVFRALKQASKPMSLAQISVAAHGIDRTSIYRTLELFIGLNIVRIIPVGWKKRYELAEPFKPHHHHLQCVNCRKIIEIKTPQLECLIDEVAKTYNYTVNSHHFELEGLCASCRN